MRIFNIEIGKRRVREQYTDKSNGFVSRWSRPPTLNTAEWLNMFSKSPRLAVVDRIASDTANIGGKLLRVGRDGAEVEITDHPFLQFMDQPNPLYEMTGSAIWRLHEIYLLLVGESFLLIERDDAGRPIELWPVPPYWVKMTPYLGSPTYQILSPSGLTMDVPVDDMFVMKQLNPLDPFLRGLGVAESIADEVEIDEYAAKFQKRFFYNDAEPSLVFLMPDATQDQSEAFMARWNQKHRGVENSHKAAALTGTVDVKAFGSSDTRELGFNDSRVAMRDAVLEHFGVPREIMGITENSNRSTADAAQYIYAKNVLMPRIRAREEAINKQLLPMFGDGLVWRFDPVVPYDQDFNKAKALDAYNAGLITKNEARELLDLPDTKGGNVFKVSINDLFLTESDDPAEVTQAMFQDTIQPVDMPDAKGVKSRRRVNISAMLRKEEQAAQKNERRFLIEVNKHFADQQAAVTKALGLSAKADGADPLFFPLQEYLLPDGTFSAELWEMLSEEDQLKLTNAIASGLLNWTDEARKLIQLLTPCWKAAYEDGCTVAGEAYGFAEIQRPEFVSAAKVNGGKRVVGIEQTTRDNIAAIISRGISEGKSQTELKKEIQSEMGSTEARAKLIARQETSTALSTGQFDMMKTAGATTKTWHHRPQKNPRPDHQSMDGETVGIDQRFSNGLRFPRDPEDGRAEQLINCHCYITYGGF